MVNIAFFELEPWEKTYVKKRLKSHKLIFIDERLSEKNVSKVKNADVLCVFIYSEITPKLLKKLPKVKLVSTMSTGFDHVNVKACRKENVTVCNVPAYGTNTVAEHAMALLLALARRLIRSVERTRRGDFSLEGLRGFDLKGKTIGILGTGRIGKYMAELSRAFGMEVIAFDRHPDKTWAKEHGVAYKSFSKVLAESDVLSLHLPETKETHHIINDKNVGKIKKGCVLINTARGGLVETSAILKGLRKGIFSACGLDVLEEECSIKEEKELLHEEFLQKCDVKTLLEEHMLLEYDNVIITPHNAFNSEEALRRILDTTIENIKAFLKRAPQNVVK